MNKPQSQLYSLISAEFLDICGSLFILAWLTGWMTHLYRVEPGLMQSSFSALPTFDSLIIWTIIHSFHSDSFPCCFGLRINGLWFCYLEGGEDDFGALLNEVAAGSIQFSEKLGEPQYIINQLNVHEYT